MRADRFARRARLGLAAAGLAALAACVGTAPEAPERPGVEVSASPALPPMRTFAGGSGTPSRRSNAEIAQDFVDLAFRLESGREIPGFSRLVTPMTVRMTGAAPATAGRDLAQLLGRLRSEAGLPISMADAGGAAAITIEFLPRRKMQARARDAACFVAPRVSSWEEYRRAGAARLDWADFQNRDRLAIFIPSDTSPQEVRDCLHEEMAQALGPVNDLYRLQDSVFNDDNMESVLTGFDMVILRATYAPELQPGMGQAQVAGLLPGVLARVNPGGGGGGMFAAPTPRVYGDAIARALGRGGSPAGRASAAREALAIAESWQDGRTGFAWLALGRVLPPGDRAAAAQAFANASRLYHANGLPLQAAHADLQLAMFALAEDDWARALTLTDQSIPAARAGQNAALLAGLLMVKAAAMERTAGPEAAAKVRVDSLGWARYGMASDAEVRRRLAMIHALAQEGERAAP